jgi:hypothetical protein
MNIEHAFLFHFTVLCGTLYLAVESVTRAARPYASIMLGM